MLPHDRETYRQQMGHVWLGFGEDALQKLLGSAGFDQIRIAAMPADPDAKGPALFVAGAHGEALALKVCKSLTRVEGYEVVKCAS